MQETARPDETQDLHPLAAIAAVVLVSGIAFAAEIALQGALPWGEEARGVIAVLSGAVAAVWLTVKRGGGIGDLGLVAPRRWWTVPIWAFGILVAFVIAQAVIPQLLRRIAAGPPNPAAETRA